MKKLLVVFIVLGLMFSMSAFSFAGGELATLADLGKLEWYLSSAVSPDADAVLRGKQVEASKIHGQWSSGSTVQVYGGEVLLP